MQKTLSTVSAMITVYVWGSRPAGFPVRTYGDMTFPAGMYEAVRVTIGSGAGHNFWCPVSIPMLHGQHSCINAGRIEGDVEKPDS